MNFLEYYAKYKFEYRDLFPKFKLTYGPGESMDPELWEIAHLYRVLICRKVGKGKTIKEFDLKARQQSINGKELERGQQERDYNRRDNNRQFQDNRDNRRDNRQFQDNRDNRGGRREYRGSGSKSRGSDRYRR